MKTVRLGKTEIETCKNGFGALPIQRISDEEAVKLLRKAYESGITFFDTARAYSDSEHKIGLAFCSDDYNVRDRIFIASKTMAKDGDGLRKDLETTLSELKTDYLDLYQLHNPAVCPKPGDPDGLYDALLEAKNSGKVRHIGITEHRLPIAEEAVESGLYETMQFPFNYLVSEQEITLAEKCRDADMGFICMKGMSGGLITSAAAAAAFCDEHEYVLPIWGVQTEKELDEFLAFNDVKAPMTDEVKAIIEADREQLVGDFCRGCGYCMPCPVGIEINTCARMSLLLRRAPSAGFLSWEWKLEMEKIESCLDCGACKSKCPYGLDTPNLLRKNLQDYRDVQAGKVSIEKN